MNMPANIRIFSIIPIYIFLSISISSPGHALEIHQSIRGPFESTGDVTAACLKCHHQQALEVLQSTHWSWVRQRSVNGKHSLYGKKDSLTVFAIDVSSNPSRCMGCHISNTRPEVNFDTPRPETVDCLVCHDTTGKYRYSAPGAPPDNTPEQFELMAREAAAPSPENCTTCHFTDCGLPQADPSGATSRGTVIHDADVHMGRPDIAFSCQDCHAGQNSHSLARKPGNSNGLSDGNGCASCHSAAPHRIEQLNLHTAVIACQTCHIPQLASKNPVILGWNWIMTGRTNRVYLAREEGRPVVLDENGFTFSTRIEPVYQWDDGGDIVYSRGQRITPQELTFLQRPSEKNTASRITPFRVVYGTQLYDAKYRYLISPLLQPTGTTFFPGSDWETIARKGMLEIVLPFSGQFSFAPTAAFRRVNHGVAPAEKALSCLDCHGLTTRMPWSELGYEKDPWSETVHGAKSAVEGIGGEANLLPMSRLQPLKELGKPPGSSF